MTAASDSRRLVGERRARQRGPSPPPSVMPWQEPQSLPDHAHQHAGLAPCRMGASARRPMRAAAGGRCRGYNNRAFCVSPPVFQDVRMNSTAVLEVGVVDLLGRVGRHRDRAGCPCRRAPSASAWGPASCPWWQARQPAFWAVAASARPGAGAGGGGGGPASANSRLRRSGSGSGRRRAGCCDVEVAGRRDQARVLDHGLQLERLVVHDHDGALLVLGAPHREPDLVAGLVVLGLHHALGAVV